MLFKCSEQQHILQPPCCDHIILTGKLMNMLKLKVAVNEVSVCVVNLLGVYKFMYFTVLYQPKTILLVSSGVNQTGPERYIPSNN